MVLHGCVLALATRITSLSSSLLAISTSPNCCIILYAYSPSCILRAIQAAYVRHTWSWCWPGAWAEWPSAHRHAQQGGLEVCAAGQAEAAGGAGEGQRSHGAAVSSSGVFELPMHAKEGKRKK
jgi:hypothetical protein